MYAHGTLDHRNAIRHVRMVLWLALCATPVAGLLPATARAASNDNNVEWAGLFHDQGPLFDSAPEPTATPGTPGPTGTGDRRRIPLRSAEAWLRF